ncbi:MULTISPECIES: DEAD/DEAH box helicase [Chryseobacterium]|uniref:DEAD/DEAH box helicase n=1 Tax=Chryseobacterium endophyticum TaxID=1854762 RepID=A0AAU6WLS9_9FLAO|nr:DEAD/DEAH box helicase [uncultured Chryseobacterium sp.]
MISFKNLHLINPIIRAVTEAGYSKPTELQNFAVPHILAGHDVIACSHSGTGKTAAFVMPILQLLQKNSQEHGKIRVVILSPAKEFVMGVEEKLEIYSKYLPLSQLSVFDGISAGGQLSALRKRVDLLVATPERLLELAVQRYIDLSKIEILVLDEADRIFETGGADEVKEILKLMPNKRQTLFFSAAMPERIRKFAEAVLRKPVEVTVSRYQQEEIGSRYVS